MLLISRKNDMQDGMVCQYGRKNIPYLQFRQWSELNFIAQTMTKYKKKRYH